MAHSYGVMDFLACGLIPNGYLIFENLSHYFFSNYMQYNYMYMILSFEALNFAPFSFQIMLYNTIFPDAKLNHVD